LILTWLRLQGVSRKGYTSRPPAPEEHEVNRLHTEAVKKQKDAAEAAAARKRKRKEKHDKACKIAHAEGKPQPAMPESTEEEEEDSSDAELNFSDDVEAATSAGSPSVYRGAGDEDVPVTLGEVRLTLGSLVDPSLARTERRSPAPSAGRRLPTPAAGRRLPTPMTGQRSPPPATGGRTPAPSVSTGPRRVWRRPRRQPRGSRPIRGRRPWVSRREASVCRGPEGAARASVA